MKKIIAFVISLICLSLSFAGCNNSDNNSEQTPTPSPAEDFEFEAGENGLTVTKYLGSAKKIVIPSVVDNKKVVGLMPEVFGGNIVVEEIVLSEYMTEVYLHYFYGCDNLKSLTLAFKDDEPYYCGSGYLSKIPKSLTTIVFLQLKTIDVSAIENIRDDAPNVSTFIYKSADSIESIPISRKESGGYNIIVPNSLHKDLKSNPAYLYNCEETEGNKSYRAWIIDDAALEIDLDRYYLKHIDKPSIWSQYFSDIDLLLEDYQNKGCTIIDTKYYSREYPDSTYSFGFTYKDTNGNLNYYCALDMFFYEHNDYNVYSCTYSESKTDPDLAVTTAFGRVDSITVNGTTYSYDHK